MVANKLEIRLLGEFALLLDNRELPPLTLKKARILVAHLALHCGHDFVRDHLATHLWPDSEIDTARFNLRQLIARIRRAAPELSPCIVAENRTTIRFEGAFCVVDALEFKRLLSVDRELALNHYRGPLLEGLDHSWLGPPRAEFEELYFGALESLAGSSPPRQAVAWLRRAIEADPYREPLQQSLLTRLAECGDSSGMQMAYRNFKELLHREMNIAPSEETERLYRQLLGGKLTVPVSSPAPVSYRSRLPVPATEILGRDLEIKDISQKLRTGRLVTLLGPGGVGKTRLAIAVGIEELPNQEAGVWFVDFSSLRDPARVAQTVGRALGLHESASMGITEAIIDCIGASPRLLILDNCEHLPEACAEFATRLSSNCPNLRLLATSRVPLGVDGEQRFNVPTLELPSGATIFRAFDIERFPALHLFESRARLVSPRFSVTAANAVQVISICEEVDALPLAIEMAAARLGALSLEEVARRLRDKLSFLKNPGRSTAPRHKTLGAVINWSYDLLPNEARTLIQRLSVFGGSWTIDAAEEICGFGQLGREAVLEAMVALTEASLIQRRDDRYLFPDTVRVFAQNRLSEGADENETRDRHLLFYQEFLSDVDARVASYGPDRTAAHFGPELDNIRSALSWSAKSEKVEAGLELVTNASLALSIHQLDSEAGDWLRQMLALGGEKTRGLHARIPALRRACWLYKSNHAYVDRLVAAENAFQACNELIELAGETGDQAALADALYERAGVTKDRGLARESLARSLKINLSLPNGGRSHLPLRLMGFVAENSGDFDRAEKLFDDAAEQARKIGDVGATIDMLQSGSHLLREKCDYPGALAKLHEAEEIARGWGDARAAAFVDLRLAELHLETWNFADVGAPLARARTFYEESHSRFHEMLVDGLTRYLAAHEGKVTDAVSGLTTVAAKLIQGAQGSQWAWWHGAGIEMEALALALSRAGKPAEGAVFFGVAQSFRKRDKALLAPSVLARWQRLSDNAGFGPFLNEVAKGAILTHGEALALAEEHERVLLRGPQR